MRSRILQLPKRGTGLLGKAGAAPSGPRTYSTNFDGTELPVSEGGAWAKQGTPWTRVQTASGVAFGRQGFEGSGGFDDSYSLLTGTWGANQEASGVIYLDGSISSGLHEAEIHLRGTEIDATHYTVYEFNLAWDGGYAQIIKWQGPPGDLGGIGTDLAHFPVLDGGSVGGGVHNGDILTARAVGNTLSLLVNGTLIAQATDSSYPTGRPGMGFYRGTSSSSASDYGFTSFSATEL